MRKEKISAIGSDKNKAARYIVVGLIVAVIFGTVIGISKALAVNASNWAGYQDELNDQNLAKGEISSEEWSRRDDEIDLWETWLVGQEIYIANLATIGLNIGLVLISIGFIGFALNDSLDERTRRASLLLAAVLMFVLFFATLYTGIGVTIVA